MSDPGFPWRISTTEADASTESPFSILPLLSRPTCQDAQPGRSKHGCPCPVDHESHIDLVFLICACSLYINRQALGFRVFNLIYLENIQSALEDLTAEHFSSYLSPHDLAILSTKIFSTSWRHALLLVFLSMRSQIVIQSASHLLMSTSTNANTNSITLSALIAFQTQQSLISFLTFPLSHELQGNR